MSADLSVKELALDPELEFINHCSQPNSLEIILRSGLQPELLLDPKAKGVYAWVRHRYSTDGALPTLEMLATEFPKLRFEEPHSTIEWVLERLKHRYLQNEIFDLAMAIGELHGHNKPEEAFEVIRIKAQELERNTLVTKNVWRLGDYKAFLAELQDDVLKGMYRGFSVGFKEVDRYTGGLRPGYLAGLSARPKRMKSFTLIQAWLSQIEQGYNPALETLELTRKEVMLRAACMISGYPWDLAQRGEIDSKGWRLLENSLNNFREENDNRGVIIQPNNDERSVASLVSQAAKLEADSILISQFRYIQPTRFYQKPYDAHAEVVFDLKRAATKQGEEGPIHVETQLNREAQNVQEMQDLDLAQLGLTDAWGQACDVMYALVQTKDMYENGLVEFGILEARNHGKKSWYIKGEFRETTSLEIWDEAE